MAIVFEGKIQLVKDQTVKRFVETLIQKFSKSVALGMPTT
jgi:hypothetical protein